MKIDLSSIFRHIGNKLEVELSESFLFEKESIILTEPVSLIGEVINTGKLVLLTGKIATEILCQCDRCLDDFKLVLQFDIEEQFCRSINDYQDLMGEVELSEDDFACLVGEDNSVDLLEIMRQNILANMPMKLLCNKKCSGIKVLKEEQEEKMDPRLLKLKEYKTGL